LPAVNITRRYFRNRSNNLERQASSKPSSMESDSINHKRSNLRENLPESEIDTVPLPTKWQKRNISLHIPSFNFSHSDNFGEQFVEVRKIYVSVNIELMCVHKQTHTYFISAIMHT